MKLTGMSFTLKMDREIDKKSHYISPGGYNLNEKPFDFCQSFGTIDDQDHTKIHFYVCDFDESCSPNEITPTDIWGYFSEFFIYTGEQDEPEIRPMAIENLRFYFDGILFDCPGRTLISANNNLAA